MDMKTKAIKADSLIGTFFSKKSHNQQHNHGNRRIIPNPLDPAGKSRKTAPKSKMQTGDELEVSTNNFLGLLERVKQGPERIVPGSICRTELAARP